MIVVSYQSLEVLPSCLEALFASIPGDCEVIVFDNASQDGSAQFVATHYPQVRLIASSHNLGYGAGNNSAACQANGDFLVFLNPDTIVKDGWLEALLVPFAINPTIGLTTPKILLMNDSGKINTCGNDIHISGITLCRGIGLQEPCMAESGWVNAISGAAFAVRREVFEALDGFDEAFFMYMEDTDFSLRARLAGWLCWYTADARVLHDYQLAFGPRKVFFQERNRYLMLIKCLRFSSLLALLPVFLLAEIVTWGYVLLRQPAQWLNKIRAYGWILSHWKEIREKRSQTQKLRRITDHELLAMHTAILDYEQTGGRGASRLAHSTFDPLFKLLRAGSLVLVRG